MTESTEFVVKPKRTRKAPVKVTKTASDIVVEIEKLQAEVEELTIAIEEVAPNSVLYPVAKDILTAKQEELKKAINHVYTA